MNAKNKAYEATSAQIAVWKKEHGEVHRVDVVDKRCYLKKPDRSALSMAATIGNADPVKYSAILLENCWVAGDEEIKTDDSYFFAVAGKLSELVKIKEATIKKL